MESNIDIKELWNRQAVPAADQSEIDPDKYHKKDSQH